MRWLLLWGSLHLCHILGAKAIMYSTLAEIQSLEYDFIIAGGGTAGLVVANRLTENPKVKVLVIEAGPSHEGVLDLQAPFFATRLSGATSPYAWNTTTIPQIGLNGRSITYSRGFVLGGSSSHNAMMWLRGSSDDYDRWAKITGDKGWSWASLLPYMKKTETWSAPNQESDKDKFDPTFHGTQGPLGISIPGVTQQVDGLLLEAARSPGSKFPFLKDVNAGRQLGLGYLQYSLANGTRTSSATAYLDPIRNRPNLTVLINTHVLKVTQTTPGMFRKIEVAQDPAGPSRTLSATKEIILSAGVLGTPHILLNSGIGNAKELATVGIKSTHNLSDVGKNLSNEPQTFFAWKTNSTIVALNSNATALQDALEQWQQNRTGPLVSTAANIVAFGRLPADSPAFNNAPDPSPGPNTPHFYCGITANTYVNSNPNPNLAVALQISEPTSRGSVTLGSSNPFDQPKVDLGFLTTPQDIAIVLDAFKTMNQFVTGPAFQGFTLDRIAPPASQTTDEAIIQFIRGSTSATSHGVGTASMSSANCKSGVVDPSLKVKGIKGLRVVDASVIPFSPSANTQSSVYYVAERASDLIKQEWKL